MRRSTFVRALALALILAPAAGALAASLPSGTIDCSVVSSKPEYGFRFLPPFLSSDPAHLGIPTQTFADGPCDNSGVIGGKGPITHVQVKLIGRFSDGTTCDTLTSTPQLEKIAFKIKWQRLNDAGHLRTAANSFARAGSVAWDDGAEALVFTTGPLKGGFAGSTATVRITIDPGSVATADSDCPAISGLDYGADGESSVTIP
jgi:hypothetical protein